MEPWQSKVGDPGGFPRKAGEIPAARGEQLPGSRPLLFTLSSARTTAEASCSISPTKRRRKAEKGWCKSARMAVCTSCGSSPGPQPEALEGLSSLPHRAGARSVDRAGAAGQAWGGLVAGEGEAVGALGEPCQARTETHGQSRAWGAWDWQRSASRGCRPEARRVARTTQILTWFLQHLQAQLRAHPCSPGNRKSPAQLGSGCGSQPLSSQGLLWCWAKGLLGFNHTGWAEISTKASSTSGTFLESLPSVANAGRAPSTDGPRSTPGGGSGLCSGVLRWLDQPESSFRGRRWAESSLG